MSESEAKRKRTTEDSLRRSIVSGVLVAIIPAIFLYFVNFIDSRRAEELTYVNNQIEKLYGPLYALTQADDETWNQFVKTYWPNHSRYFFDRDHPPTSDQVDKWRLWMTNVFQPLNIKMENIIVTNSQLIIGSGMPSTFRELIAQTEAYKAILAAWKESDKNDPASYVSYVNNTVQGLNYPTNIISCVQSDYETLTIRQQKLRRDFFSGVTLEIPRSSKDCDKSSRKKP